MSVASLIRTLQDAPAPDFIVRPAIAAMVAAARRRLPADPGVEGRFAEEMACKIIAEHVDAANAQHYELPPEFFRLCLGPRLKYSCCFYATGAETLAEAEENALAQTCAHAGLADGQRILELGCGWGSLTLWMAERYPRARITAVSNSAAQRRWIEARARENGLTNVTVLTRDMNVFDTDQQFDRIVSVEMFEHMANWRALLTRARTWLEPRGRMFIHVFSHRTTPYRFDASDQADFIARHFFTGGIMPSHGLMRRYEDLFEVESEWRWSGVHYERTALDWLARMDAAGDRVDHVMNAAYGAEAVLWTRRWRRFFLATAGLFGDRGGSEWGVSHYRLAAS
jgi:cyclopropane-fatty-acyl-phospholipid synthase